ncbi:MAG: trigger factor [Armatimonadetes bacterium]|nr:trigger factor [Armatimonadota bacterium]
MPIIQQEQTKPCEILLEIEVEQEEVSKAFDKAYKEIGRKTAPPGFRKGKAPRAVLERYVSQERVKETAVSHLIVSAYEQALKEAGVEPFAKADFEVLHIADAEPFKFKATVPLAPTVELGQYVGIEIEKLVPHISEEDVQSEIEGIMERSAEVVNVEGRPVQKGDLIIVLMVEEDKEPRETVVEAGKNLPSFDEGLIGMSVGETKSIEVVYPEDHEDKDLAGSKFRVVVTIRDIKERRVPELTDEFVRGIAEKSREEFQTVEELRDLIRTRLESAVTEIADRQVQAGIIDKLVDSSNVCFPDVVLEHEVERRLDNLILELKAKETTLDEYLRDTGRSFEQIRSQIESSAGRDIKIALVIEEIAKRENIKVTEEDLDAEIAGMAERSGVPKESLQAYLDKTGGKTSAEKRVLRRKVLDFLVHASNIKNVGRAAS